MTSYCYNLSARGHKVYATVHPKPGPVLITFHGGGIIQGSRRDEHIPDPLRAWPGTLVEADYRLLAPSSGLDIYDDCLALLLFLSGHPRPGADATPQPLLTPGQTQQIIVAGFSGGAYPCRLAGIVSAEESHTSTSHNPPRRPRFKVCGLLCGFGMGGDFLLDLWLRPLPLDSAYTEATYPTSTPEERASLEEAQRRLTKEVDSIMAGPEVSDAPYSTTLEGHDPARQAVWDWFHACGTLNDLISGRPGLSALLAPLLYASRLSHIPDEVAVAYPQVYFARHPERMCPILLNHGDRDPVVPYAESLTTVRQLEKYGAGLITVPGTEHNLMLDNKDTREGEAAWEYALKWALEKVNPSMH